MILECIVTTMDGAGLVNIAPMGVIPEGDTVTLKPYRETATYRNLKVTPSAVVHLVDDAGMFARSALGDYHADTVPAERVRGAVLTAACSWMEVEVVRIDDSRERAVIPCSVVHRGRFREFLGYNRARNAILEATILATRTRFLPPEQIWSDLDRLNVIVGKTGDAPERASMDFIMAFVREALG